MTAPAPTPPRWRLVGARVPLRTRLIALIVATTALVVVVTGLAGSYALRTYLLGQLDSQLRGALGAAAGPASGFGTPPDGPPRGRRGGRSPSALVVRYYPDGSVVTTGPVGEAGGPALGRARTQRLAGPTAPFTVPSVSAPGRRWRAIAAQLSDGGAVVVAVPQDAVDDTVARLLRIDALVGLVALLAAGGLAFAGVRGSLRPLVQVEATAEAIAAGDLSRRVPAADPRTEVGSLSASFNAMVDRFESAYRAQQASEAAARSSAEAARSSEEAARGSEERMRRFVADASHELRTPLTSIRGFAELFRQGAVAEGAALVRVMRRIEDEAARMGLLVEDLLLLARLDQQRPLLREQVDLLAIAADVVHDASAVTPDHVVRLLPPSGDEPPVVLGDDARLRQVVGNLVANAVTHTPPGTTVDVLVGGDGGDVRLQVRDDGPGMPGDVAARVFERFYRADASRTRSGTAESGSGLGLSIVAALVAAHGGSVEVDTQPGAGTCFCVRLPAASAPPG